MSVMTVTTRITHKYLMGKHKHELADMIMKQFEDSEMLDWLDDNVVELAAFRDVERGDEFQLEYNTANGCTAEVRRSRLRKAITEAMKP